jgi:hypothetical protein
MRSFAVYSLGVPFGGRHLTKEGALRAAQRRFARVGGQQEVVWLNDAGRPKLWLAFVSPAGVNKTTAWGAAS